MKKIRPTHWEIDSLNQPLSEKIIRRFEHSRNTDSFYTTKKFTHQSGGGVVIQTPLYEEVA